MLACRSINPDTDLGSWTASLSTPLCLVITVQIYLLDTLYLTRTRRVVSQGIS